jgi:uncharacterized glyoxalase superfamily protein PhnB
MVGKVKPIPDGYHSITPHLVVQNSAAVVEFLQKAFGAKVVHRRDHEDGSLWHADVQIGDSQDDDAEMSCARHGSPPPETGRTHPAAELRTGDARLATGQRDTRSGQVVI